MINIKHKLEEQSQRHAAEIRYIKALRRREAIALTVAGVASLCLVLLVYLV